MIELSELKRIRKQLGLTQSELARLANVSQSLIAKVESGKLDPAYTKAKRLLDALNRVNKKEEAKIEEIMQKRIIAITPSDTVAEAAALMKKHAISQLPVIEKGKVLGLVTESSIIANIHKDLSKTKVAEIMNDAPPIVPVSSQLSIASELLRHVPILLAAERGKIIGLLTKADLIKRIK